MESREGVSDDTRRPSQGLGGPAGGGGGGGGRRPVSVPQILKLQARSEEG